MSKQIYEEGGCLCGAVRFRVTAAPYFVAVCSCTFCQRLTGSDYNVESMFREAPFTLTGAAPAIYTHISEGSGMPVHVHFCVHCGTSLFLRPDRFPDCVGILSGTFDNPNWFERSPGTAEYFFVNEAPRGMVIPAGFNTYSGHARALDGSDHVPIRQAETVIVGSHGLREESE